MNLLGFTITRTAPVSRLHRNAVVVGIGTAAVLTGLTGTALAVWTSSGTGSGTAKAGSATALSTVTASAATTGLLYPSGTGDVKITFDNPNPYPVTITSVAPAAAAVTASAGTCTTTGVSFTAQSGTWLVPKKSGTDGQTTVTFTGAVSMSNASDDGCQGATFTIPVTFTGASS
jgi:hypothetical protein